MKKNIIAGVTPGGLTDKYLIKILICFILNSFEITLKKEMIEDVLQSEQLANYFILQEALAELEESKHVLIINENDNIIYKITELGRQTAENLSHTLPKSLKDTAIEKINKTLKFIKNQKENEVEIIPYKNGYFVKMILHDTDFDLMDLSLFAPDLTQAKKIKKRFLENPTNLYKAVLDALVIDKKL